MRDYSRNYNISLLDHKKASNPFWKIIFSFILLVIILVVLFYNRKQNKNITSNNTNINQVNSISKTALIDSIEKVISQNTGTYSVYIYDIKNNVEIGIREKTIYTAASVNKIPILASLYFLASQGKIDLDKKITPQPKDIQDYGTGSMRYDPTSTSYSLKTIARLMMEKSDNTAAYLLGTIIIGMDEIQKMAENWGLTQTDMVNNKTSNYDISRLLIKMYRGEIASKAQTLEMLDFMRTSDIEDRLPAGLPEGTKIYHKTGDEVGIIHDAGIIELQDKPYYIGIFTTDITDQENTKKNMGTVSKLVYEYMKKSL